MRTAGTPYASEPAVSVAECEPTLVGCVVVGVQSGGRSSVLTEVIRAMDLPTYTPLGRRRVVR